MAGYKAFFLSCLLQPGTSLPQLPYQQKIKLGLNKLVKTSSAIAIGVSKSKISILNMNLSDSVFPKEELDDFILNSLIPKIFVPIAPLIKRLKLGCERGQIELGERHFTSLK